MCENRNQFFEAYFLSIYSMSKESLTKNLKYLKGGKEMNINIRQFNLKMIRDLDDETKQSSILMIAKRNSGKSWICRSIICYFSDIPAISVIAPTEKLEPFYSKFVPDLYVHYIFQPRYLSRLFERQEKMIEKAEKYKKLGKFVDKRCLLVMDDCLASKKIWESCQQVTDLMFNGRHFHIMYMLTIQKILGINPDLRSQMDFIFILKCEFVSDYKKIYEHYAGMFPTLDVFKKVFKEITKSYGAMVLINKGMTDKLSEKVMWYRAKKEPDEFVGCQQYINNHKYNYNPDCRQSKRISSMGIEDLNKSNIGDIRIAKENDDEDD
jgi:hypothetical protein